MHVQEIDLQLGTPTHLLSTGEITATLPQQLDKKGVNMKQCLRCGGEVPEIAQACMHCAAVFTDTPEYQAQLKSENDNAGCAYLIVGVLFVIFMAFYFFTGGFE